MKIYNYLCYFISSLMPLYFIFVCYYTMFNLDINKAIFYILCFIVSIILFIIIIIKKTSNIFICNHKEIFIDRKIKYKRNIILLILYMCVFNLLEFSIFILPIIYLAFIFLLYRLDFKIENIILDIFGFKKYTVRNKIIYSKKSIYELSIELKKNKYIQILEISDNIYIEKNSYVMKKDYCM